jgi:hypothetical protein
MIDKKTEISGIVEIGVNDLEDAVAVFHLVASAMQSEDVARNYQELNEVIIYRPLTKEVERIHSRLSGFLKDLLYEKYQNENEKEEDAEES